MYPPGSSIGARSPRLPLARILPTWPALELRRTEPRGVFGITYLSVGDIGSQADVFYGKIAGFHGIRPEETGTLLGHAMAHELGHLLLGSNSHSVRGIMCAEWRTADLIRMTQGSNRAR